VKSRVRGYYALKALLNPNQPTNQPAIMLHSQ